MGTPLNNTEINSPRTEKSRSASPELHPLMAVNAPSVTLAMSTGISEGVEKNPDMFSDMSRGGIDDGFLTPGERNGSGGNPSHPPSQPRDREDADNPRFPERPLFPPSPNIPPEPANIPRGRGGVDLNVYAHKKTLAQGMMDIALLSANANQLRYVLDTGSDHPYFYVGLVLISTSIILQLAVGVGLILNSRYNIRHLRDIHIANKINNFTVLGIFLITMMNVFISAFGVGDSPITPDSSVPPERYEWLANNCTE